MKIGAKMKANKIQQMDLKPVSDLPAVLLVVNALFLVTKSELKLISPLEEQK